MMARRTLRRHTGGRSAVGGPGSSSLIETLAGSVPFQSGLDSLHVGLGNGFGSLALGPGIAEDANGNLYVATGGLGVVLKVDSSSNVSIYAGNPVTSSTGRPLPRWWVPGGGSALTLLLFSMSRSRRKAWLNWAAVLLFAVCLNGALGCSAIDKAINGDHGGNGTSGSTGTPLGTYSIKVTASSGTGTSVATQPTIVSLTITQ